MKDIEGYHPLGGERPQGPDPDPNVLRQMKFAEDNPGEPIAVKEIGPYDPKDMGNVKKAARMARRENKALQQWLIINRPELAAVTTTANRGERMYVGEKREAGLAYVSITYFPNGRFVKPHRS